MQLVEANTAEHEPPNPMIGGCCNQGYNSHHRVAHEINLHLSERLPKFDQIRTRGRRANSSTSKAIRSYLPIAEKLSNVAVVVSARCEETSHYIKELVGLFEEGSV